MEEHGPRRKLTTILCADCAGYSRMMRADEEGTYRRLQDCRQLITRVIGEHEGRIFGSAGDSVIAEFPSPVEAVRAAVEIQHAIEGLGSGLPEDRRMHFRIGINLGDVMIEGEDLIGDGVNVAARLQGLAEPGSLSISGSVYEQVRHKLALDWKDLGDQIVKNIAEPVRAYRVRVGRRATDRSGMANIATSRRIRLVGAAGVLLLLSLTAVGIHLGWRYKAVPQCNHASIAVLPFANLSGDPAQDYFSDGTTEDMIAALGRFSDLSVIARVAVQQYKGKPVQPGQLSRDLGVCYALEGSVRKSGEQAVVGAQLIDALSGRLLWSDSYDGDLKDLFTVRNRIAQSVVGKLAIKLQDIERRRAFKKPTDSLDAYEFVLRGRDYYGRNTRPANTAARKLFEQAIQRDPTYASAYAALGLTRVAAATSGWTEFRDEALRQAESLAQKAIELDADNAEAHRLLGDVYFNRVQFDLAIAEHDRAIALNPNDAESHDARGRILVYVGRPDEALKSFEIANRLNPNLGSGQIHLEHLGWAYYLERRYEEAVAALTAGVRAGPDDYYIHAGLAAAYAQLGRKDQAAHAADDLRRVWPFFEVDSFVVQFQGDANRALVVEGLRKAGLK
ncbi:MAG: adenylate cyclase [Rhodospirillaceae bacterium]|nr:adenylate cyclase [Rhodospirillaceae bacterium]